MLTIAKLAAAAGVTVETVRFYQRRGLIHEPPRPLGGVRRYSEHDVARIRFIKAAQRIGFTLEEIRQLLQLEDGTRCEEARLIAEHKRAAIKARMADLIRIETALSTLIDHCRDTKGTVACPLIAALQGE
jgi:MerR family mercuric resistance operon transcriptional regulator